MDDVAPVIVPTIEGEPLVIDKQVCAELFDVTFVFSVNVEAKVYPPVVAVIAAVPPSFQTRLVADAFVIVPVVMFWSIAIVKLFE